MTFFDVVSNKFQAFFYDGHGTPSTAFPTENYHEFYQIPSLSPYIARALIGDLTKRSDPIMGYLKLRTSNPHVYFQLAQEGEGGA